MKYHYLTLLLITFLPHILFAGDITYRALVGIPGYGEGETGDFSGFVNLIYGLAIVIAALLAVIKIVIAGVKWMLSDVVTDKGHAKKDIQSALFGLIIIISAVLIITVINPDIVGAA
jgi:hypothetical protein